MSIVTDARSYADAAIEQGKTAFVQASTVVSGVIDELPALRPASVTESAYAALGAADLLASSFSKRVEAWPAETVATATKVQETGKARLSSAQEEAVAKVAELRGKFDARVASLKTVRPADLQGKARSVTGAYVSTAKGVYDTLAARGETRLAELRTDPRFTKVVGEVTPVVDQVLARVRPVVDQVEATVSPVVDQVLDTVKAAAGIAPIAKSGISSTVDTATKPAAKRAARKAPAKKAPAKKASAAKVPAKKAAAKKASGSTSPSA